MGTRDVPRGLLTGSCLRFALMPSGSPMGSPPRVLVVLLLSGAAGTIASAGCRHQGPCVPCVQADSDLDAAGAGAIASVHAHVDEVQVGPTGIATTSDHQFQLFAWYQDADGTQISGRFDPFYWDLPSTAGTADRYGLVTLKAGANLSIPLTVRDEDNTFSDKVTLRRWKDAAAAGLSSDVVVAAHQPKRPPSAVLLEEGAPCAWGQARAFVGIAAVGHQNPPPCSVALFSTDHAAVYQKPPGWSKPFTPPLVAPLPLDVAIFIAVTGQTASLLSAFALTNTDQLAKDAAAGAEALARMDVAWANVAFEANRVGVRINPAYVRLDQTDDLAERVGAHPFSCAKPRGLSQPDPLKPDEPYENDKSVLSVYYVDWIDYPTDPLHAGARGVHCHFWQQGQFGPVIFISYTKHSTITLAHEIGHALGLDDEEEALGALNLMHNLLPDGPLGADARSRLTVGQVFRMNVWNDSWVRFILPTPRPTRLCRTTNEPCPPVALDAR